MNLLRSICCAFGRCEEPTLPKEAIRRDPQKADLGQTEAELEKSGKEQMSHMDAKTSKPAPQQPK
jgi:hypothetical protein